jgi:anti-sigma regulatory factor (Ser/Thr protein kinase)
MQGETSRAVAVREQVRQESEGKSTSERYAIELRELVRNVPTWANDLSSGGDVAVAILETSTKTLNWLHRPAFCH